MNINSATVRVLSATLSAYAAELAEVTDELDSLNESIDTVAVALAAGVMNYVMTEQIMEMLPKRVSLTDERSRCVTKVIRVAAELAQAAARIDSKS